MRKALTRSRFQEVIGGDHERRGGPKRASRAREAKGAREKVKYQRREGTAGQSPARPERHCPSTKDIPTRLHLCPAALTTSSTNCQRSSFPHVASASARHYLASAENNFTVRAKAASSQGHRQPQTQTQKPKVTKAQDISICPSCRAFLNLDSKGVSVHFMIHSAWTFITMKHRSQRVISTFLCFLLGNRDRDILSSDF